MVRYVVLTILLALSVHSKTLQKRIVGGQDASTGEFPYVVSIRSFEFSKNFCAGAIVSNRHVVSAAHCLFDHRFKVDQLFIVVGAWHFQDDGERKSVEWITLHPQFNETNLHHDISVLKTRCEIEFTLNILPIALPSLNLPDMGGVEASVSGWGRTVSNKTAVGALLDYGIFSKSDFLF